MNRIVYRIHVHVLFFCMFIAFMSHFCRPPSHHDAYHLSILVFFFAFSLFSPSLVHGGLILKATIDRLRISTPMILILYVRRAVASNTRTKY